LPSDTRSISRKSLTMSSWVKFGLTTKADNATRHLSKSLSRVFQKMKFYLEENYVSQPIFPFRSISKIITRKMFPRQKEKEELF